MFYYQNLGIKYLNEILGLNIQNLPNLARGSIMTLK